VKQPTERAEHYSTVDLLPSESSVGFEELRKNLIAELAQRAREQRNQMIAEEVDRRGLRDPMSSLLGGDEMATSPGYL
jgi:hypothetical protein